MPRDLPPLDEPKAGRLMIQYAPDEATVLAENPPRFTWLPVIEDEARYALRVSADPSFPKGATRTYADLPLNVFTPPETLEPGTHHWSYAVWEDGAPASDWSAPRRFDVPEGLPETPLPSRADRLKAATREHPRLWMTPDRLSEFRKAIDADPDHCTWRTFLEGSVQPWMDREVMEEPAGYPGHQRVASV